MRHLILKRQKEKREADKLRAAFDGEFPYRCWICGVHWGAMHIHEIARGPSRRFALLHRETWLYVCEDCHLHKFIHGGQRWADADNLAMQYALKRIKDPKFYNREFLNELRGRAKDAIDATQVRMATALVMEIIA